MLLKSTAGTIAGTVIIYQRGTANSHPGWIVIWTCGLIIAFSVLMLMPGLNDLQLTPDKLSIKTFGWRNPALTIKWSEVSNFTVVEMPFYPFSGTFFRRRLKIVGIVFAPDSRQRKSPWRVRMMERSLLKYGCDGVLSDTYGMNAEDFVTLLNEWRTKYF